MATVSDEETEAMRRAIAKAIDDLLERYRDEKGKKSQRFVARKIGVTQPTLSAWANEQSLPAAESLLAMRKLTGRSIDDLLGLAPLPSTLESQVDRVILARLRAITESPHSETHAPSAVTASDQEIAKQRIAARKAASIAGPEKGQKRITK